MKRTHADEEAGKEDSDSVGEDAHAPSNAAKEIMIQDAKKEADSILAGAADAKERADSIRKEADSIFAEAVEERESLEAEKQQWEAEKAALAGVQHFESVVKLDVGGVRYTTSLTTLRRFPDSMIGCMFSGRHALPKGEDGYFFIDRDGTHFRHILNFLRSPEGYKVLVTGAEEEELRRECEYYGIDQLMFDSCDPTDISPLIATRKDSQGVYTVRGRKGTVTTELPDVVIEFCPFCHEGGLIYWDRKLNEKCQGGVSAAQPRVQGPCRNCGKSS